MRTSIILTAAAAALALVATPGIGTAKSMQKHTGGAEHGGTISTPEFVKHAAQGGMAEVSIGKLAADKASDPDVKQFAQRMVDDHSKANADLTGLASSKGIQLPANPDPQQQALMDRLAKLSGAEFDRAYMEAMVTDHDHDVSAFRTYSQHGTDPDVKAWAARTLPTLEEHQQMAKTTVAKVGGGTRTGKSSTIKGSQASGSTGARATAKGSNEAPPR